MKSCFFNGRLLSNLFWSHWNYSFFARSGQWESDQPHCCTWLTKIWDFAHIAHPFNCMCVRVLSTRVSKVNKCFNIQVMTSWSKPKPFLFLIDLVRSGCGERNLAMFIRKIIFWAENNMCRLFFVRFEGNSFSPKMAKLDFFSPKTRISGIFVPMDFPPQK